VKTLVTVDGLGDTCKKTKNNRLRHDFEFLQIGVPAVYSRQVETCLDGANRVCQSDSLVAPNSDIQDPPYGMFASNVITIDDCLKMYLYIHDCRFYTTTTSWSIKMPVYGTENTSYAVSHFVYFHTDLVRTDVYK